MERPRRRGIGRTLPVGWMYKRPPNAQLKAHLQEHARNRRKKEEQESAERAARAKERENEEEKKAWHKKQIAEHQEKIEQINAKRKELDDMKNVLFDQLKEVFGRGDVNKVLQDEEALFKQLMQSHSKEKQESSENTTVSGLIPGSATSAR